MMDATVKSRHPNDARESRLNGFLANASLDTVLFNSSLLSLKGFYGRLDSEGDGSITDGNTGDVRPWREYAHTSDIYGVSGNFSMPLLLWGHRVVVDTGVDYRRVRTDPYTHEVDMGGYSETLSGGKLSSYSLALPTTVSVAKDFVSHWGLITARFGSGFIYEFSDSANGVRALNARAARPLETAGGFVYHPFPSSSSYRRGFYHVNLGLDFQSPGGWNMRLDYRRDFAGGYSRDNMQFALGRSF